MKIYIACNYQDYQTSIAGVYSEKSLAFSNAELLKEKIGGETEICEYELNKPFNLEK